MRHHLIKSTLVSVTGALMVVFLGCADSNPLIEKIKQPAGGDDDSNPRDPNDPTPGAGNHFDLTITANSAKHPPDPVELLFVLDNSASMKDNIKKLKESTGKLFTDLKAAAFPYTARILTMDRLLDHLDSNANPPAKVPAKLFAGDRPQYNRGAHDGMYSQITTVNADAGFAPIESKLNSIISDSNQIANEPGICLAMDYINWNVFNTAAANVPRFVDQTKVHAIVLSDEDNSSKYQVFDTNTNTVTANHDLICYQEQKAYNKYLSWKNYCYRYDDSTTTTTFTYTGRYRKRGLCQLQGEATDAETDELLRPYYTQACFTNLYSCEDTNAPNHYQCRTASGYTEGTAANYASNGTKRCELAQNFECRQFYDGQEQWLAKDRAAAVLLARQGATCRVVGSNYLTSTVSAAVSQEIGVRNCAAFTCTADGYARVNVLEQNKANTRYRNCSLTNSTHDQTNFYTVQQTATGVLQSVTANACAAHYTKKTINKIQLSTIYCENNLKRVTLPAGIILESAGTSVTGIVDYTKTFPSKQTKAQVAAALGVPEADVHTITESDQSSIRTETQHLGCWSYPYYAAGDPVRSKPAFAETITAYNDVKENTTPTPPPGNRSRAEDITVKKVYEVGGVYTDPPRHVRPTAVEFNDLMRDLHPLKTFTVHSVVNQTGQSCSGLGETNIAKGAEYMKLSDLTSGVQGDVCADNFDAFIKQLSQSVLTELDVAYKLPDGVTPEMISSVTNTRTEQVLKLDTDYWFSTGHIVFEKKVIGKGDKIRIDY